MWYSVKLRIQVLPAVLQISRQEPGERMSSPLGMKFKFQVKKQKFTRPSKVARQQPITTPNPAVWPGQTATRYSSREVPMWLDPSMVLRFTAIQKIWGKGMPGPLATL